MSPREAKLTPICEIYLALEGRFEYLKRASVFNGGPNIKDDPRPGKNMSNEAVANTIKAIFGKMKKADDNG